MREGRGATKGTAWPVIVLPSEFDDFMQKRARRLDEIEGYAVEGGQQ